MPRVSPDQVRELHEMVKDLKGRLIRISPKLQVIKDGKKFIILGVEGWFLPHDIVKLHSRINSYIERSGDEEEIMMMYAEMFPSTSDDK
ncbi:hypothetical protein HS125_01660 [bacterium]|nr:hypothetical protein [bacterium]